MTQKMQLSPRTIVVMCGFSRSDAVRNIEKMHEPKIDPAVRIINKLSMTIEVSTGSSSPSEIADSSFCLC